VVLVKFVDLPCRVKAVSTENEDGSYTVILNSKLNYEQNVESFKHEIRHIEKKDFDKDDVDMIELLNHV